MTHPHRPVPALGVARRLQALAARGWSAAAVAERCHLPEQVVHDALHGVVMTLSAETDDILRRVYEDVWDVAPPAGADVEATLELARAHDWAVPMLWDDEDLDDPDGRPWCERDAWVPCWLCGGFGVKPGTTRSSSKCTGCGGVGERPPQQPNRTDYINIEDVRLLARAGNSWDGISARLGCPRNSLITRLNRAHERELLQLIARNSISTHGGDVAWKHFCQAS